MRKYALAGLELLQIDLNELAKIDRNNLTKLFSKNKSKLRGNKDEDNKHKKQSKQDRQVV